MRIVPGISTSTEKSVTGAGETARTEASSRAEPAAGSSGQEALQSASLQPALKALESLPEIDQAKVAAVRDALAKGELPFDAAKLASLIESYHRAGQ